MIKSKELQGMSYWKDKVEGIIFIYVAEEFEGNLKEKFNKSLFRKAFIFIYVMIEY